MPDEQVVRVVEFETSDPALQGEMTFTIALRDADGGIEVIAAHDGRPRGVAPADSELGWRIALDKLARSSSQGDRSRGLDLSRSIAYLKCLSRHVAQWESTTLTR